MIEIIELEEPAQQKLGSLANHKYDAYADVAPNIRFWRLAPVERERETWYFGMGETAGFHSVGISAVICNYGEGSPIESFTGWRFSTALGSPGRPKLSGLQEAFEIAPEGIRRAAFQRMLETHKMAEIGQAILRAVGMPAREEVI